jgi:hypothetical protein
MAGGKSKNSPSQSQSRSELDQAETQNKEAARQLSIILIKRGVNCTIITTEGFSVPSVLRLGMSSKNLSIFWRAKPEKLGCELRFVQSVSRGVLLPAKSTHRALDPDRCIGLVFLDYTLQLETVDAETCSALHLCLQTLLAEVRATEKAKQQDLFANRLRITTYKIATQQEKLYQLHTHSSYKGA